MKLVAEDEACGCVCDGCLETCRGFTEVRPEELPPTWATQVKRTLWFLALLASGTLLGTLLVLGTVTAGVWVALHW